ncbi:MAG: glutamate--tRNA ligase [Microbacteriaceae bacterium]
MTLHSALPFSTASGSDLRVRFCPSPTGTPHVGLIRTALFNWAEARRAGGKLIFRIEDTDASRDSEESYEQLIESLNWLKIDWDEGVVVGGPDEPYRQSERHDLYADVIRRLLDAGLLYESFVTPEEMEQRNIAAGRDPKQGYDNFERELSAEARAAFRAEGRTPALRLRVPDTELSFHDLVRGDITFPAGSFTDFVVVRPNGIPLYTFVNPVDDALMGVTHVLRGEDLLSSTPRQIALYLALIEIGVTTFIPNFGHLPFVTGEGNKKLSKRDPESSLFLLREQGFIAEGLTNYLALLGWSISADRDVFTREELAASFSVSDVNPNPARFDIRKATSINGDHIRMLDPEDFQQRILPYLSAESLISATPNADELAIIDKASPLIQERMNLLGEAPGLMGFLLQGDDEFVYEDEALKTLPANAAEVLAASVTALEAVTEFSTENIEQALRAKLIEELELKPRIAFGPARVAVSGRKISPPLFESLEILGQESTLARLNRLRALLASTL